MTVDNINLNQLQSLIGHHVDFEGQTCRVIEILEDGPSLILQAADEVTTIQPDQHGEAHRRVPSTVTVPIIDRCRTNFHPDFISLNLYHLL